jgi:hypothetical protein
MWLFFGAAHGGGVQVLVRGGNRAALNGAPVGIYTSNVVTARCYSDSSCGYGVLWGLLWTPSFFPGPGLKFRPRGWVGLDCIRLKWGFYIYQTFPP